MSSSEAARQAENITPPTASATPGVGVTCFTTSTSSSTIDLYDANGKPYDALYDRYIDIVAVGADIYFAFDNDSTGNIDETVGHASSITSATTESVPWIAKDGVPQSFRLTKGDHRYLHLKAASGTPKFRIRPSSQPSTSV